MQGKNLQAYCRTSKLFNAADGKIGRKAPRFALCEQALGNACAAGPVVGGEADNDGPNEPKPIAVPGLLPDDGITALIEK